MKKLLFEEIEIKSEVYHQKLRRLIGPVKKEFQVNTYTANDQSNPAIATIADGGFVITWSSYGQDGSGWGIYGQRYTSSGVAYGSEFLVNTYTANDQGDSAIAATADGGFVISWDSYAQDGSGWDVYAKRYAASGIVYGLEFRVNTYISGDQGGPAVGGLSDGGYIITWSNTNGQDGSYTGCFGQRYTSSDIKYGSEFQVNTYTPWDQTWPEIAILRDGGYVITWLSDRQDGSKRGIYAQRYSSSNIKYGFEFQVNTYTRSDQTWPTIAALPDGGYLVVWESNNQDGSGFGIYGRRYNASGIPDGPEFRANSNRKGDQQRPVIAALPDDRYVIVWKSSNQDGSGWGIYGQQFTSTFLADSNKKKSSSSAIIIGISIGSLLALCVLFFILRQIQKYCNSESFSPVQRENEIVSVRTKSPENFSKKEHMDDINTYSNSANIQSSSRFFSQEEKEKEEREHQRWLEWEKKLEQDRESEKNRQAAEKRDKKIRALDREIERKEAELERRGGTAHSGLYSGVGNAVFYQDIQKLKEERSDLQTGRNSNDCMIA